MDRMCSGIMEPSFLLVGSHTAPLIWLELSFLKWVTIVIDNFRQFTLKY